MPPTPLSSMPPDPGSAPGPSGPDPPPPEAGIAPGSAEGVGSAGLGLGVGATLGPGDAVGVADGLGSRLGDADASPEPSGVGAGGASLATGFGVGAATCVGLGVGLGVGVGAGVGLGVGVGAGVDGAVTTTLAGETVVSVTSWSPWPLPLAAWNEYDQVPVVSRTDPLYTVPPFAAPPAASALVVPATDTVTLAGGQPALSRTTTEKVNAVPLVPLPGETFPETSSRVWEEPEQLAATATGNPGRASVAARASRMAPTSVALGSRGRGRRGAMAASWPPRTPPSMVLTSGLCVGLPAGSPGVPPSEGSGPLRTVPFRT